MGKVTQFFTIIHIFFYKNVKPIIWDKTVSINGYGWRHQHEIILWGEMPEAKPIPTGDGDIIKEKAVPIDTRIHPAEKPIELLKKLISKSAKPGDRILDTHGGSMSIAIACHDLGFDLDLYEIDADYFKAGSERLKRHQAQMRMF